MSNENYESGKVTIQQQDRFTELKDYVDYLKQKKIIQDKYPNKPWDTSLGQGNHKNPYEQDWWDDWISYKKEISDLMFKPNGSFQKFTWKIQPERNDLAMRVWLRGKYDYEAIKKERDEE